MFKYIFLLLAVIVSLLLPYYFANVTVKELRKELADKNQKINELLDEKVGGQEDCERKMKKLEDEINFIKGQVSDKHKEFDAFQEILDVCSARSHISHEKSNHHLFYIIVCGMIVLLLAFVYYASTKKLHKCENIMQIQQHQKAITANESKSKRNDFVLHISINF